jgi:hypothetical protein
MAIENYKKHFILALLFSISFLAIYKYIYSQQKKGHQLSKVGQVNSLFHFMVHLTHTKVYAKHLRPIIVGDSISIPTKLSSFALAIGKEITHWV